MGPIYFSLPRVERKFPRLEDAFEIRLYPPGLDEEMPPSNRHLVALVEAEGVGFVLWTIKPKPGVRLVLHSGGVGLLATNDGLAVVLSSEFRREFADTVVHPERRHDRVVMAWGIDTPEQSASPETRAARERIKAASLEFWAKSDVP